MSTWSALERELALWRTAGRRPTVWWRDDDARELCEGLVRLLALSRSREIPLALAVIPEGLDAGLSAACENTPVSILQHGYRHRKPCAGERKKTGTRSSPASWRHPR